MVECKRVSLAYWINWNGGTVPTSSQIAQFGVNPTGVTGVGINFSNTTNSGTQTNGQRVQEVGAIEVTSARAAAFIIGNSSGTVGAAGTLQLNGTTVNGISNVILRNNSSQSFTIQNTQGSGNQTMSLALGNATANVISIDGTGNILISSIISGSNRNLTLNASGSGSLVLSGANTYSGTTVLNSGVMNIRNATALGSTAAGTSVAAGAAIQIQGGISVGAEALTLNGMGVSNLGALRNISGANSFGGLVTLGSSSQINSDAGSLSLSNTGVITGSGFSLTVGGSGNTSIASIIGTESGGLTKVDGGTLTLSGANTFSVVQRSMVVR